MEIHKIICDHCKREISMDEEFVTIEMYYTSEDGMKLLRDHHFCSDCEHHIFRAVVHTILDPDTIKDKLNDPNNSDEYKNYIKFINDERKSFDDDLKEFFKKRS